MLESEYAKTEYIEKDNMVFHVCKKKAHYDDYREPVTLYHLNYLGNI